MFVNTIFRVDTFTVIFAELFSLIKCRYVLLLEKIRVVHILNEYIKHFLMKVRWFTVTVDK